jgi:hypothetical protein
VVLVISSIRQQLEDGATLDDLKHELDLLPDELDGLDMHMLQRLNQSMRKRTCWTLQMLEVAKAYNIPIFRRTYYFMGMYEKKH